MKFMSRGMAVTLALGVAAAGVAVAHAGKHGHWRMSAEQVERLQDGKIAGARTALKLTPDQEKLWAPVEAEIRAQFKARAEMRAERDGKREARRAERAKDGAAAPAEQRPRPNMAERIARVSASLSTRADRMKAFSAAFGPFYAALDEEQKAVLGPVMRDLRVMGGRRHGHHSRWARHGGSDEGKGWRRGPRGDKGGSEGGGLGGADGGEAPL